MEAKLDVGMISVDKCSNRGILCFKFPIYHKQVGNGKILIDSNYQFEGEC